MRTTARTSKQTRTVFWVGLLAVAAAMATLGQGCPSSTPGPEGPQGPQGETGATGAAGADGQLRIYGDGSNGAYTVIVDQDWTADIPSGTYEFTDFAINAGQRLTVPSGLVVRCTGTFTNNGTLVVLSGASGASRHEVPTGAIDAGSVPATLGVARRGPFNGDWGDAAFPRGGGEGATAWPPSTLLELLDPGLAGGSGGGAALTDGGAGGGSLVVLAQQGIVNNGAIFAHGSTEPGRSFGFGGGGGGGGGFVVLASRTQVTNSASGSITANGGDGATNSSVTGAGGGGGGGVIHLIAPTVTNNGSTNVAGGLAGSTTATVIPGLRAGGGGGGACGGSGGSGATVASDGTSSGATDGAVGLLFISTADPTPLF